ncbi:hypothetical protein BG844_30575 [Couchioplanes caeruleus subsp. caeruleus]|uniref:Transposase IS204/IS1001/IS1096/IS1165 DDE domain-containing protein n=1 Tax=Couchioplanes caeruleus subsp. caeruleus TaxID=56427 RepID=A0A1K0FD74_9ACTN|nr:hypothetical protein BG844_30575 [Couchioplanes caeruleus subsp. caeruleus]
MADRFHLWQNLATAVERLVAKHKGRLVEHPTTATFGAKEASEEPQGAMAQRRRAHYALVYEMLAQGAGFRQIARHLGWNATSAQQWSLSRHPDGRSDSSPYAARAQLQSM